MRYLAYAIGIVFKASGVLLVLTAGIIRIGGRPNSRILLISGAICFTAGALLKRVSRLKKCHRCLEKMEREAARCRRCGFDFPITSANLSPSLSIKNRFYNTGKAYRMLKFLTERLGQMHRP